jgi:hypothetical protein
MRDASIVKDAMNMYTDILKEYGKPGEENQTKREKALR